LKIFWTKLNGIVVRGHQVASRASEHYPAGTIELQSPFFHERGLDLSLCHSATINVSIEPLRFKLIGQDYLFRHVEWTTKHPPEDFSFSSCRVTKGDQTCEAWIYYPHPETKARHHQDASIIEVISPYIDGLEYGDRLVVEVNETQVAVFLA